MPNYYIQYEQGPWLASVISAASAGVNVPAARINEDRVFFFLNY